MTASLPMLLICALAAARLWRFASEDDMPLLVKVRARLLRGPHHPAPDVTYYGRSTLAHLVGCPWCLGSYLSIGVFALARLSPGVAVWVLGPLAIGELVGLIVRNLDPKD